MTKILYKDLSYKLVGCFYEVYNKLGPGHKEQVYHNVLKKEFDLKSIKYNVNKKIKLLYKEQDVGVYVPDFIIDDKIIVEVKSVLIMPNVFEKQLYYYLAGTEYRLGYIVNFGSEKIDIRRRVYDLKRVKDSTPNVVNSRILALDSR